MPIRSLDLVIADLDTRQRPAPGSLNRPQQKIASVNDVIALSSETTVITVAAVPYHWHDAAGTTALSLVWAMSEWG